MPIFSDDTNAREVNAFGSPNLIVDSYGVPAEASLGASNIEYLPGGQIKTRYGTTTVFATTDVISSMAAWQFINLGNPLSYLVYFSVGVGLRIAPVVTPTPSTIVVQTTATGAVTAPSGSRIYAAFYNNKGQADSGGYVYSLANGADPLFLRPPLTTEVTVSFIEGAANSGSIVAGVHMVGFYLTTANGYTTKLAPLNSSTNFVPQTFTASGGRNVTITFTPGGGYTWPTGASLTVVMTTATNLQKFLTVPLLAPTFVAGGGTYNVVVDISDSDLSSDGTDVTLQQTVISQSASSAPPFLPEFLSLYGERMGMTGRDAAGIPVTYFSEPNSYQTMTASQHTIYLPGNLIQTSFFQLRGVCYLMGPHWTYSVTDSGQVPAQWSAAQLVDATIGALGPNCVWVNPATGIAWVADQGGLYTFSGGQYSRLPVSYYVSPIWKRINWTDPTQIFVVDDKDAKVVKVLVPLDSATKPSHILNFYYVDGVSPEQIKFSLDTYASYSLGAATLLQGTTGRYEVWIGPSVAGNVVRINNGSEAHPYRDVAAAIDCQFETGMLPGLSNVAQPGTIFFHHAIQPRVTGEGTMGVTVYSLDHVKTVVPVKSPIALSTSPGIIVKPIRFSMVDEEASVKFTNSNTADSWFRLSQFIWVYSGGPLQR